MWSLTYADNTGILNMAAEIAAAHRIAVTVSKAGL